MLIRIRSKDMEGAKGARERYLASYLFMSIPLRVDSPAKIDRIVSRVPPAKFSAEIEIRKKK